MKIFSNSENFSALVFLGRPTEIDESDVYVVESKVRGYESGGKRCSLTGCKSSHYASKNVANDCTVRSTNEQKASQKADMVHLPSKMMTEDFHSNVPSTSKVAIERPGIITKPGTVSASLSNISIDDDSSSRSNQIAGTMHNTSSVDHEEPMNDAYAKKLKQSLKVSYLILQMNTRLYLFIAFFYKSRCSGLFL